jgi:hypothetical protein
MAGTPRERLLSLREKIERQRNTIRSLKREGHECPDAERELQQLLAEQAREKPSRRLYSRG